MTGRERRPIFTLRIEGEPGAAGIHALRALLKVLPVGDGKARAIAGIDRRSR